MESFSVMKTLNNHRSIRLFSSKPVEITTVQQIIHSAQQMATSMYMQQYSVIQITNSTMQTQIANLARSPFIAEAPVLLVMVADQYRNLQIAKQQQQDPELLHSMDKFMAAVFDTTLATASIVTAAESQGLGATVLGSIQNDGAAMVKMLQLPTLTLPLLGIVMGYPDEKPAQKPRLPLNQIFYQNTYPVDQTMIDQLDDYDELVRGYYATRQNNPRQESFKQMVAENLTKHPAKRDQLLNVIHQQGFALK